MGELFWNKVAGAVIGLILAVLLIGWLSDILFHTETDTESFAYPVDLAAIQGGSTGGNVVEEIYDLGLLLASADASAGERVARRCTSCHTFEPGGGTLQGPNLHGIVGQQAGSEAGFSYSAAMAGYGQAWTYENLDAFIANPRGEVPGTSMSFAGIRNDEDRADLLAYLAEVTPGAPAFPAPLPAEEEGEAEDGSIVEPADTRVIEQSEGEPTSEDPSDPDAVETGPETTEAVEPSPEDDE